MSIEQKLCKVKICQLQSMSNAIGCINQRFAFKNSRISCLALIFNNLRTTVLYTIFFCAGLQCPASDLSDGSLQKQRTESSWQWRGNRPGSSLALHQHWQHFAATCSGTNGVSRLCPSLARSLSLSCPVCLCCLSFCLCIPLRTCCFW